MFLSFLFCISRLFLIWVWAPTTDCERESYDSSRYTNILIDSSPIDIRQEKRQLQPIEDVVKCSSSLDKHGESFVVLINGEKLFYFGNERQYATLQK